MQPTMLDLYSGAGGAAYGYRMAGWHVTGVDINPQPRYAGHVFHQGDALEFLAAHGHEFDAVHASPPCQHYANVTRWRGDQDEHVDLLADTRDALTRSYAPWVIENVPEAPLRPDFLLCGSMFDLRVRRHRAFETSGWGLQLTAPCNHRMGLRPFNHSNERAYADAMGCSWMSAREGRQAVPPAYTEHIGLTLLDQLPALTTAA
ncbi:DNA cytosine methyltransferase [Lentzea albida]|uniref:DNA (Cytosine-5)-methyltransferase 1 n=1 Tax=Lentzea albida TaxID=65499 RepID=A0A1H9UBP6_9PSEU|nr:DNA cytosine methyltransferase [Lentzea albida]SES06681.1 DNA (cytosine-5)-methyltransferase 1 [Lentzea albida]